jgi:UDP-N-acetylmuramyl tripeptide synthase
VELIDSRRLTGLNLQTPGPGAVAEVCLNEDDDIESVISAWSDALDTIFDALDWTHSKRWTRRYTGGLSLIIHAPLDALYAATEVNEWAVAKVMGVASPLTEILATVRASLSDEANPALLALQAAAHERDLPFVWDDDEVSVGLGRHSQTWPARSLPEPSQVDWESVRGIPYAYVTGTNGKTTTTRMTMHIASAAGVSHGGTSSDGVVINGDSIEEGDWTGPGAARLVLRHSTVDLALLETARGGLLRRGLVLDSCDAAVITNIADDHLGEYGVCSVEDMAEAKGIVCRAVRPGGYRILNADDPHLWTLGTSPGPDVIWFSLEPHEALRQHIAAGGRAWTLEGTHLTRWISSTPTQVLDCVDIPATHGGLARHNIANALAAASLADAVSIDLEAICRGLSSFGSKATDNPGRCNLSTRHGVRFLLDFGHNPHGVRAILGLAQGLKSESPTNRMVITIGQAGDRSNADLTALATAVADAGPDRVLVREIPGYERGRAPGEVSEIIVQGLEASGQNTSTISRHLNEADAMSHAVAWAKPGDLVVHLIHLERDAVRDVLDQWSAGQHT